MFYFTTFEFKKNGNNPKCKILIINSFELYIESGHISPDQMEDKKDSLEKMFRGENSSIHFALNPYADVEFILENGMFHISYETHGNPFGGFHFFGDFEPNKENIKEFIEYIV